MNQDVSWKIQTNTDGHFIEKSQEITNEYLERLKTMRHNSMQGTREKDFMQVASIPICIVDKWLAEGYSVFDEPIRKSVAKLKHENLEYFITTGKQI